MQAVKRWLRAGSAGQSPIGSFLQWLDAGLGLFYPAVCQICGQERATAREGFVGPLCAEQVTFIKPPFCSHCGLAVSGAVTNDFVCSQCLESPPVFCTARTAVVANAFMLDVIHRYKYAGALYFEPFLAQLLIQQAASELRAENWDCIVPVPLHSVKKREREFNQAERLGRCLSRAMNIPMNTQFVRRVEPTRSQTTLSRKERAANVQNAFMPGKKRPEGQSIILLDDVMTTGATTNACAKALLKAGARKVCVWTVARGVLT